MKTNYHVIFTSVLSLYMISLIGSVNAQNKFPSMGSAGIGTTSPNSSSLLEIKSTSKGLLIPRMTLAQRDAIISPATSLLIYQTNSTKGFHYYDGSAWQLLPSSTSSNFVWKTNGSSIYYNTGNVGINKTNPAYKLDVTGDINISSGSALRINAIKILKADAPNQNLFVGNNTGDSVNGGYNNTAVGSMSFKNNINGDYNTAVGANSLMANKSGNSNAAVGEKALYSNTTGYYNAAFGSGTLYQNISGSDNTAIGFQSLYNNTTTDNTAVGFKAAYSNTTGLYNTAIGDKSLYSNATGTGNTALGYLAVFSNTSGASNTANGFESMYFNTTGAYNTSIGALSLYKNTTGFNNTAIGTDALNANTTGAYNTAVGTTSLLSNTGNSNTAVGEKSMQNSTTGGANSAFGSGALQNNAGGNYNIGIGFQSLYNNTNNSNTAVGYQAMYNNTSGSFNTAIGYQAGFNNNTGSINLFEGEQAGYNNTSGAFNCFGGFHAGYANTTGNFNTYYGYAAGISNKEGSQNTFVGFDAGLYAAGDDNTFVGYQTSTNDATATNSTAVGSGTTITEAAQVWLGNAALQEVASFAQYFFFSDGRYKRNIKEDVAGLDFIKKLRPVTYTIDAHGINKKLGVDESKFARGSIDDKEKQIYNGFIAQEVEAAAKQVGYNFSGVHIPQNDKSFYGISYSDFVVPLVKAVTELSQQNDSMKSEILQLKSEMDELRSMILSGNHSSPGNQLSVNQASLDQNVPNPFNGSSSIGYFIPTGFHNAQLMISNALGQILKSYSIVQSGIGNIIIYNNELPVGIYQYSLLVDGKILDTKKMVLAK